MKKILFLTLALTLLLAGCSKDDDSDKGLGNFDYDTELLFGTWKITKLAGMPWKYQATTATFNPDGSYYGKGYFGTGSGTYKLSGTKITCYVDGKKYMWYDVLSIDGIKCNLIASDDTGSIVISCEKQ